RTAVERLAEAVIEQDRSHQEDGRLCRGSGLPPAWEDRLGVVEQFEAVIAAPLHRHLSSPLSVRVRAVSPPAGYGPTDAATARSTARSASAPATRAHRCGRVAAAGSAPERFSPVARTRATTLPAARRSAPALRSRATASRCGRWRLSTDRRAAARR